MAGVRLLRRRWLCCCGAGQSSLDSVSVPVRAPNSPHPTPNCEFMLHIPRGTFTWTYQTLVGPPVPRLNYGNPMQGAASTRPDRDSEAVNSTSFPPDMGLGCGCVSRRHSHITLSCYRGSSTQYGFPGHQHFDSPHLFVGCEQVSKEHN